MGPKVRIGGPTPDDGLCGQERSVVRVLCIPPNADARSGTLCEPPIPQALPDAPRCNPESATEPPARQHRNGGDRRQATAKFTLTDILDVCYSTNSESCATEGQDEKADMRSTDARVGSPGNARRLRNYRHYASRY